MKFDKFSYPVSSQISDGLFELFYENGQLKRKESYKRIYSHTDTLDGIYEEYYENGQIREKGNYERNRKIDN